MDVKVITLDNEDAGTIALADEVFGLPARVDILHRMVRYQLAKRRAGTHKVKTISEIAGSTAKIYRQKGTGRARHGAKRANIFRGGATVHGPVVRSHAHDLPKKVRRLALKTALSVKAQGGKLVVVDELKADDAKTKALVARLEKAGLGSSTLFIGGTEVDQGFRLAARNLIGIDVLPSQGANVYDILRRDTLVLSRAAVESLEARLK
ncbi:MAG: 50S ribosomal protein L4 [Tistrella sp.]|jgi:large subunit ribosomal protein L4|uniref:Large ribosomal subunit protein uL4 n=2 Tax=Tistrella mobilis TaxID=171437 RepID=I3TNY1_TISMK|nr:50S ribosomal protein L4 [Tistrella mobilis]AFK54469.1 50S ribosomal protein L4P [Tistrella mobilis KA081020-065]KYO55479.1 50S ribosomal protein L4 [Tistrella mobilis]MBA75011.1 50S ribosomal protein L4 [Tistrella sp.]